MQIADMPNILVFLDYNTESTYLIKTIMPIDSIIIPTKMGVMQPLRQVIESYNDIASLVRALRAYGISGSIACLDNCSVIAIN